MDDEKPLVGDHRVEEVKAEPPWEWDHRPLLYRGGAAARAGKAADLIGQGALGLPAMARLPLILKVKEAILDQLATGGSRHTAMSHVKNIRKFYAWSDTMGRTLTIDTVASQFLCWTDHLEQRRRNRAIKTITAYTEAQRVAGLLDSVLDLEMGLLKQTRIRKRNNDGAKPRPYRESNLDQLFAFGHVMCDLCEGLTAEAIRGSLPILIEFRSGKVIEHWCGLRDITALKTPHNGSSWDQKVVRDRRQAWSDDTSLKTRSSIVNLRVKAEMLIFIAQTGMNLAQVRKLKTGGFSYQSHLGGYTVRHVYKARRQGQVSFDIYSEYRTFFERYLLWRRTIFPADEELLFPVVRRIEYRQRVSVAGGQLVEQFHALTDICNELGVRFIGPRLLRKTRINWLARRSKDFDITAEMAQHSKETLLRNYLQPDPQVAAAEISQFYKRSELTFAAPGPGICIQPQAKAVEDIPRGAPQPDCVSPAGCMFCTHQRDVDSEDHAWSLVTYRHLKTIELATNKPVLTKGSAHPSALVIVRATEKLELFRCSSDKRREWVEESIERVKEGVYHPMWRGFIELAEVLL